MATAIRPDEVTSVLKRELGGFEAGTDVYEVGTVLQVGDGIARIYGLSNVQAGELVEFPESGVTGMVLNLEEDNVGVVLFGDWDKVIEGAEARRTRRIASIQVTEGMLGRVIDSLGNPVDGAGPLAGQKYEMPLERKAPGVIYREPVKQPLQTGIKSIDSMIPIGRGQRELVIGDRQTGKTAIAVDTILNQRGKNVYCVYVAIGQKASTIAGIIKTLEEEGALDYTIVVASTGSDAPSMQYIAPYAGCAIAEEFMYAGKDALIVYDDLSKHAVAYRTMSLLLRRPPGREAYPGDVFYLHSRLLERAARLNDAHGGGSMTALPIIETMAGDISAYIPTNVISITDGQIFLESELFNAGIRPAVNVGLSVSRVGGSAQIKAMRKVAGRLRLDLAQYRELAVFAQFASDLDKTTRETLDQGARLTESLKQQQYSPLSMASQVIVLYVAVNKYLVKLPFNHVKEFNRRYLDYVDTNYPDVRLTIDKTGDLPEDAVAELRKAAEEFIPIYSQQNAIKLENEVEQ